MGKVMIVSEEFEIRELIARDLAAEGHRVVTTGNPTVIRSLIAEYNPDLTLLDLHLHKINPGKVMGLIRKKSLQILIFPFSVYTNEEGNLRMVIAQPELGETLSFQDFKSRMNALLSPMPFAGKRSSPKQCNYPEV